MKKIGEENVKWIEENKDRLKNKKWSKDELIDITKLAELKDPLFKIDNRLHYPLVLRVGEKVYDVSAKKKWRHNCQEECTLLKLPCPRQTRIMLLRFWKYTRSMNGNFM